MSYYQFWCPAEEEHYGSFEVFEKEDGFYWQERSPGCSPDSDEFGPFTTLGEAVEDAMNYEGA